MEFNYWLQSRLTAHGFPVGQIDGLIGPKTIAALKAFEKRHGQKVDGTADPKVVELLRKPASSITATEAKVVIRDVPEEVIQKIDLVPIIWPRQSEVPKFFGEVGKSQTKVEVPFDMYLAWDTGVKIKTITMHEKVAASAESCLQRISQIYSSRERGDLGINLFGGSLNVRKMRGGSNYSMHSWGIALDFDPIRNQLSWNHKKARLAEPDAVPFWDVWQAAGWLSLGRARDFDWMHVQAARL